MKFNHIFCIITLIAFGCQQRNLRSDAYGNFESSEVTISSEGNGKLTSFKIEEGDVLQPGDFVGQVDTLPLYYKMEQLKARLNALYVKTIDIPSQINVLKERKKNLERERDRISNLLKEGAATQKQFDDMRGEIEVIDKELNANQERLEINNAAILSEAKPLKAQMEELQDQINRCRVINPVRGTVLAKYAEANELTGFGKPLYKIADLTVLYLRAYVSGDQLDDIRIGQKVKTLIDKDEKDFHPYEGEITWISSKSEFTPKIVQTKSERVNLVYAIKVKVVNDGKIKIGMPGEVKF